MSERNDSTEWPAVFRALSASHRREIIRHTVWETGEVGVNDLTDHLALTAEVDQSEEQRELIAARLYHIDIPMLVDANLVEWDEQRGILQASETVSQLPVGILSPQTLTDAPRQETGVVSD